jgi:hypothetical protein
VAQLTPEQRRRRDRIESLIRLAAPGLSLLLAAGERLSKLVEPEDQEYYPPRSATIEPPPGRTGDGDADAGASRP